MIGPVEKKPSIRIAGYLEKRGKMKLLVCRWKRWWFVLEGRLLLYYKSQLEYLNLSPCRGSLNMGLASSVRPGKGLELTVITRSQAVTLRACNRVDHEQWLQSLVDAMALPNAVNTFNSRPVMHFRYAKQEYHENIIEMIKNFRYPTCSIIPSENGTTQSPLQSGSCETSASSSHSSCNAQNQSEKCSLRRVFSDSRTLLRRPCKRNSDRSSVRLSKIAFSDTSIPVTTEAICGTHADSTEKCQSMQELHNGLCTCAEHDRENEHLCKNKAVRKSIDCERALLNGSKESKLSNSIKIELNLEDIENKSGEALKEQKIGNIKIVLDGCAIYGSRELNKEAEDSEYTQNVSGKVKHDILSSKDKKKLNLQLHGTKEAKSDTDLTIKRKKRGQSLSCENMQTLDRSIGSTYNEISARMESIEREQRVSHLMTPEISEGVSGRKSNKKRSNSILSRFMDSITDSESAHVEHGGTIRKRLSFLRKVWKKREKKKEEEELDYASIDYDPIPVVIELPSPKVEKAEELLLALERHEDCGPEPEPPPDYDISLSEELDVPPMLPPRVKQRAASPWHDVPKNNKPVLPPEEDLPPPLPLKTRHNSSHHVLIKINENSSSIEQSPISLGDESVLCEPPSRDGEQKLEDLDALLSQLSEVNTYVVQQIDISQSHNGNIVQVSAAPESDYDVPRPHLSLLATLHMQNVRTDSFTPTHFLCTAPLLEVDSLDPILNRLDAEMTPDSLECESLWSLTHSGEAGWPRPPARSDSFASSQDKIFPDSLNS